MSTAIPGHYTPAEAADVLHKDVSQVIRYINTGLLKARRVGRQWLIEQADVHTFQPPPVGNPNFRQH